jgi:hypothetical protein
MSDLKKILADYDTSVKKGIDTNSLNGGTGTATLTTRQDLDPVLTNLAFRNTPFRDMVKRSAGQGAALTFNTQTAISGNLNPRDMTYADGGLPTSRTTVFGTKIVPYVSVGLQGAVTGLAQAQGESFLDLYANEVENVTRAVIQGEEWLNFWGSTTTLSPTGSLPQYAGLDELISTNTVDASGGAISKLLIDEATELIAQQGGQASHMFTSIRVGQAINNIYNTYSQVIINGNDRQAMTFGNMIKNVSTVAGILDVVPDFFINPGNQYPLSNGASSTPSGATTSTVFIVSMPFVEMRDLKKIGMEELGRVADKRTFYVNEYTAMKLTAEKWCCKIENVLDTSVPSV